MKRLMLAQFGFEKSTPEIMAAWVNWFESAAGNPFIKSIRIYEIMEG